MSFIFSTPVFIRHLWKLMTVVILHGCINVLFYYCKAFITFLLFFNYIFSDQKLLSDCKTHHKIAHVNAAQLKDVIDYQQLSSVNTTWVSGWSWKFSGEKHWMASEELLSFSLFSCIHLKGLDKVCKGFLHIQLKQPYSTIWA
jgi:hypothetical protein